MENEFLRLFMVKIRFITVLLILSLLLASCSKSEERELDLFSRSFSCEYSYAIADTNVRVRLTSVKKEEKRELTLTFIEPSALEGIVCKGNSEDFCARLGDVEIDGAAASALASSASLFSDLKKSEFCARVEEKGQMLEHFRCISSDGSAVSVYLDGKTELPVKISGEVSGRMLDIFIVSFERIGD